MTKLIELPAVKTEAGEYQIVDKNEDTQLERATVRTAVNQIGQINASHTTPLVNHFKQAVEQYRSMENVYLQSNNNADLPMDSLTYSYDVTHHKINMILAAMDSTHQEMNQMPDRVEEVDMQDDGPEDNGENFVIESKSSEPTV